MNKLHRSYLKSHNLYQHYTQGTYGGLYLGFKEDWKNKNLPKELEEKFDIVQLDTLTGQTFKSNIFVAHNDNGYFLDNNYYRIELSTLNQYVYGSHHCACHRKQDARESGIEVDEECEGRRFLIQSITVPNSSLILCSETYSEEQLLALLV